MSLTSGRYPLLLAILFLAYWTVLAIEPRDRADWLLENLLAIVFAAVLVASFKRLPLSRISYSLIFLFLCLHTLGAHYTYSQVPYDAWTRALFGASLNETFGWERNQFDRLVHFSGIMAQLHVVPYRKMTVGRLTLKGWQTNMSLLALSGVGRL